MSDFIDIPLSDIRSPIKNFRSRLECASLADDMKTRGLLQPIIVRHTANKDDAFDLVAGHRRFAAAKRLRWKVIPCHVLTSSSSPSSLISDKELIAARVVENMQRSDLSTYEIGSSIRQMRELGHKPPEIAKVVGLSKSAVNQYLMLTNEGRLAPEITRAWKDRDARLTLPNLINRIAPAHEHSAQIEVFRILGQEARTGPRPSLADGPADANTGSDTDQSVTPGAPKLTPLKVRKILAWMEGEPEYVKDSAGRCIIATLRWSLGQTKDIHYGCDIYADGPLAAYQAAEKKRLAEEARQRSTARKAAATSAPASQPQAEQ